MAVLQPLATAREAFSIRFLCYLLLALLSSGLKVRLPGVTGTLSVSFLFILAGMAELGPLQTLAIGIGSALVQIYWNARKRPPLYQVLFNLAAIAIAIRFAEAAMTSPKRWESACPSGFCSQRWDTLSPTRSRLPARFR